MVVYRCCDFADRCRRITSALGQLCLHKSVQHLDCKCMLCYGIHFCLHGSDKTILREVLKDLHYIFYIFLQSFSDRVPPQVIRKSIRSVQWLTNVLPNSSCIVLVTMFLYWSLMCGRTLKLCIFLSVHFCFFAQQKKITFLQRSAFPF